MADWLTLEQYKAWARITDTMDDEAIQQNIDAVDAKFRLILRPDVFAPVPAHPINPPTAGQVPADVTEAGLLYVNRLLSRRNSPDGVVGVSDVGTATILPQDSDIKRLLGPYLATVLA
jgi:hypothetical protein